jgi:2Fe-2S ferredoxin
MKHTISWPQFKKTIEAAPGQTILDAALDSDIPLEHVCGGFCACTTCHIQVKEGMQNISPVQEEELERLEFKDGRTPNSRLACQSKVYGNVVVEIP